MSRWIAQRPAGRAAAISLFYILGGSAWLVGSDLYIHGYSQEHLDGLWESIAKGLGFVVECAAWSQERRENPPPYSAAGNEKLSAAHPAP